MQDSEVRLNDEAVKVFLNIQGTVGNASEELQEVLEYFKENKVGGIYTKQIEEELKKAKMNKDWRRTYMTMQMREMEKYDEGVEFGMEQGRREGIKLTKLVLKLDAQGYAISDIATEAQISVEEVKQILEEA